MLRSVRQTLGSHSYWGSSRGLKSSLKLCGNPGTNPERFQNSYASKNSCLAKKKRKYAAVKELDQWIQVLLHAALTSDPMHRIHEACEPSFVIPLWDKNIQQLCSERNGLALHRTLLPYFEHCRFVACDPKIGLCDRKATLRAHCRHAHL